MATGSLKTQKSAVGFVEEIDIKEIDFGQVVGRGAFGVVLKAKWRDHTVAVKQIETENEKKAFVQELKQLSRVNHENIIKLYGASTKYPVFLVMEFAECGSMYNLLHGQDPVIEYKTAHAISWALQSALGVNYLHNMKPKPIIHRDLKPPNLLLVKRGMVVKLCDFGTAADAQTHMTNNKGSAAWMAPEVFEGNRYSEKCDVFSWGIVLWECLSRKKPFDEIGGPAFRIMWAVHSGTRPPLLRNMPKCLEKLMTRCWSKNAAERPSMSEVVRIMNMVMPYYKNDLAPLVFPGFFIEGDEDVDQSYSNESEQSLQIDDILNNSANANTNTTDSTDATTPTQTNRFNYSNSSGRSRESEEVLIEPLAIIEPPTVSVVEADRRSSTSSLPGAAAGGHQDMSLPNMHPASSMSSLQGISGGAQGYSPRHYSRPGNPQNRYSAEIGDPLGTLLEHVSIQDPPKPAPRKRYGHRRVGSHGNPPIKIDPQYALAASQPQSHHIGGSSGISFSMSQSHPGEHSNHIAGDMFAPHPNLNHSRSWTPPENNMMATAYRQQRKPDSTPTPPPSFSQLDDFLRPLQPLPNSQESMIIYYEHVDLAERYVKLQQETHAARARVADLRRKLEEERNAKQKNMQMMQELQKLADENENYTKFKQSLEQQARDLGLLHSP